jgi:hypothetical protein
LSSGNELDCRVIDRDGCKDVIDRKIGFDIASIIFDWVCMGLTLSIHRGVSFLMTD